jgi:hypothetical protein
MAARCSGFIRYAVEIMESSCSVRASFLSLFSAPTRSGCCVIGAKQYHGDSVNRGWRDLYSTSCIHFDR